MWLPALNNLFQCFPNFLNYKNHLGACENTDSQASLPAILNQGLGVGLGPVNPARIQVRVLGGTEYHVFREDTIPSPVSNNQETHQPSPHAVVLDLGPLLTASFSGCSALTSATVSEFLSGGRPFLP